MRQRPKGIAHNMCLSRLDTHRFIMEIISLVSTHGCVLACRFVAELPVKMAPLLAEVEATKVGR
jgi:hypothetical protein